MAKPTRAWCLFAVAQALALATGPVIAADTGNISLPDVSVTAPQAPVPAYKNWGPYFGNPRVEEEKWPDIPCNASRISAAATGNCKTGMSQESFVFPGGGQSSNCRVAHDLVMTALGPLKLEADVMVFDPYYVSAIGHQHKYCWVESPFQHLADDFPDMNRMTRRGSGWRNLVEDGDLSTMEFVSGSENCLAIEKRGPRWGGGYVYVIHASICRSGAVAATDVTAALASLQVRTYEPRGNLVAPQQ